MSAPRSLLDEVLPRFDASEVHAIWVPARPHVVFTAVKQVNCGGGAPPDAVVDDARAAEPRSDAARSAARRVNIRIPGCPPTPDAIADALLELIDLGRDR